MNRTIAVGVLLSIGITAQATDFGVGVSLRSNDTTIYVPIDINEMLRVEPAFSYARSSLDEDGASVRATSYDIGAGLFRLWSPADSVQLYLGGRAAYTSARFKQRVETGAAVLTISNTLSGYRLTPTIGFEYRFADHFSLGGEAGWRYSDVEDTKSNGTVTNVILRYRF
jgi:opacity protein-like surface antigen